MESQQPKTEWERYMEEQIRERKKFDLKNEYILLRDLYERDKYQAQMIEIRDRRVESED